MTGVGREVVGEVYGRPHLRPRFRLTRAPNHVCYRHPAGTHEWLRDTDDWDPRGVLAHRRGVAVPVRLDSRLCRRVHKPHLHLNTAIDDAMIYTERLMPVSMALLGSSHS